MIINFHLSDGDMACHIGGEVDNSTYPIHIPDKMLPRPIQDFLKDGKYCTLSLSYTKDSDMTQVITSMPNPNLGKYLEALKVGMAVHDAFMKKDNPDKNEESNASQD